MRKPTEKQLRFINAYDGSVKKAAKDLIKPISRAVDGMDQDSRCSVCGDDTIVIVIQGRTSCNYCGNEVFLCSVCCGTMKREMNAINDGLDMKV